jgi:hypothetical protein
MFRVYQSVHPSLFKKEDIRKRRKKMTRKRGLIDVPLYEQRQSV